MKRLLLFFMTFLLVMSTNAQLPFEKGIRQNEVKRSEILKTLNAENAKIDDRASLMKELKAIVAQQGKYFSRETHKVKKDVSTSSVTYADASYFDGRWTINLYDADSAFVGSVVYVGNDATHLVAANLQVNDTNYISLVNGSDTLQAISGSFSIIYDHVAAGIPYYHVVTQNMNSEEEAMEINAEFPVVFAYDYEKYYYSVMYSEYCGTYLDCDYVIDLEDAPFELTGETINVVINDLIWFDHVADKGWWQIYGMNADSTVYITLSNSEEVSQAAGTYTLEMMDEDYTLFYVGTSYATLAQVKIKELEFTLTLDNDGNPHITGTLISKDGVVYILTLGGAPKVVPQSDNQITLAYANGIVSINTTNNDNYFFTVESKEEYDSYQSDLTQASIDSEISGWIASYVYNGKLAYVTYSGNQSFTFVDLFNSAPEAGDYVALAAGITDEGDMTTTGVYLLFTYHVGDSVPVHISDSVTEHVGIGILYYNLNTNDYTAVVTYESLQNNYSGLTSVDIPTTVYYNGDAYSVTSIGYDAFYGCSGLTSVTIPNSVTSIGYEAFDECSSLTSIYVPCGEMERFKQLLNNDSRVKYAPVPYSITINAENGSVTYPQTMCDDMQLTATPNYGYHFVKWSNGNTDNPRTIELTQDTAFSAIFEIDKSGTCGDNLALRWEYDTNGKVLSISGSGTLNSNYLFGVEAPDAMEKLVIAEGVTTIGNSAFAGYTTLEHISLASSVRTIYEQAFYNCTGLQEIYSYRDRPSVAYSNSFDGIDKFECTLHVLSASVDMYRAATGWRDFYYIQTIDAEAVTQPIEDVAVTPSVTTADIAWPTVENAATYELTIRDRNGNVICTLVFNAQGQLQSIAFSAPGRSQSSGQTAGFTFTVTGLDSGSQYGFTMDAKDTNGTILDTKSGTFTTTGGVTTNLDTTSRTLAPQKLIENGQLFILLPDGTRYSATGVKVE